MDGRTDIQRKGEIKKKDIDMTESAILI